MDDKEMRKFDETLATMKLPINRDAVRPETVFTIAEELHQDITALNDKLRRLDDALHKAMGALLDAAHIINKP